MKLNDFNFCLHYHIKDVVSVSFLEKTLDYNITYLNGKSFGLIYDSNPDAETNSWEK